MSPSFLLTLILFFAAIALLWLFVQLLEAAGFPLLRIPTVSNYKPVALEQLIRKAIHPASN